MKKLITISLLSLLCSIAAMAQEQDPWVGTWTSESYSDKDWENSPKDEAIYTDYKLVIKITKNGDQYVVRAKTIKVKDSNYSSYHRPFTVTRMERNTMWLESYVKKDPFTVDYGNGPFVESYHDFTYFFKLTLNNGILHYSYYKNHRVEYDMKLNYKEEETANVSNMLGNNLDLFNDGW
jgi:hypothetical protein